jgi:hypothetical protein
MSVQRRIEELEKRHGEAVGVAWDRILSQLTDEEIRALAGPQELWDGLSDEEVAAIAKTGRVPAGLQLPEGLTEYEPPAWVLLRVWELATPAERALLGLGEP